METTRSYVPYVPLVAFLLFVPFVAVPDLDEGAHKRFNDSRIELGVGAARNLFNRPVMTPGFAIRPVRRQGVVGIGDSYDSRSKWNLGAR